MKNYGQSSPAVRQASVSNWNFEIRRLESSEKSIFLYKSRSRVIRRDLKFQVEILSHIIIYYKIKSEKDYSKNVISCQLTLEQMTVVSKIVCQLSVTISAICQLSVNSIQSLS